MWKKIHTLATSICDKHKRPPIAVACSSYIKFSVKGFNIVQLTRVCIFFTYNFIYEEQATTIGGLLCLSQILVARGNANIRLPNKNKERKTNEVDPGIYE